MLHKCGALSGWLPKIGVGFASFEVQEVYRYVQK